MIRLSSVAPPLACSRQYAAAQRDGANVPLRCTSITASHSSSVMFAEHAVAQDAGVVDHHVQVAVGLDGLVDQPLGALPARHAVGVDHGLAAGGDDLVGHGLHDARVAAGAVGVAADVVEHQLGAVLGEHPGVLAPDASAGPGDDAHPAFTDLRHRWTPLVVASGTPAGPARLTTRAAPGRFLSGAAGRAGGRPARPGRASASARRRRTRCSPRRAPC